MGVFSFDSTNVFLVDTRAFSMWNLISVWIWLLHKRTLPPSTVLTSSRVISGSQQRNDTIMTPFSISASISRLNYLFAPLLPFPPSAHLSLPSLAQTFTVLFGWIPCSPPVLLSVILSHFVSSQEAFGPTLNTVRLSLSLCWLLRLSSALFSSLLATVKPGKEKRGKNCRFRIWPNKKSWIVTRDLFHQPVTSSFLIHEMETAWSNICKTLKVVLDIVYKTANSCCMVWWVLHSGFNFTFQGKVLLFVPVFSFRYCLILEDRGKERRRKRGREECSGWTLTWPHATLNGVAGLRLSPAPSLPPSLRHAVIPTNVLVCLLSSHLNFSIVALLATVCPSLLSC